MSTETEQKTLNVLPVDAVTQEEWLRWRRGHLSRLLEVYAGSVRRLEEVMRRRYRQWETSKEAHLPPDAPPLRVRIKLTSQVPTSRSSSGAAVTTASSTKSSTPSWRKKQKSMKRRSSDGPNAGTNDSHSAPLDVPRIPCLHAQCAAFAFPLSQYCFSHILHDQNQKLFISCSHRGCRVPALRTDGSTCAGPPLCHEHVKAAGSGAKSRPRKQQETKMVSKRAPSGLGSAVDIERDVSDSTPEDQRPRKADTVLAARLLDAQYRHAAERKPENS